MSRAQPGDELTPQELALLDAAAEDQAREEQGRFLAGVVFDEGRDKYRDNLLESIMRAQAAKEPGGPDAA